MLRDMVRRLVGIFLAIAVGMSISSSGCINSGIVRTVAKFEAPHIILHTYEDPDDVESNLISEGPEILTGPTVDAHFVITGTGVVWWGELKIVVSDDSISIDGVLVESISEPGLYRNVTITRDGAILKDRWIPFE